MNVSESTRIVLFTVLFVMVLVWLVLVKLLVQRLAIAHTRKYCEMGRPALFSSSNATGTWAIFKFLLARQHRGLGDRPRQEV